MGSLGQATVGFERCDDVPNGGLICALPALLAVGLLRHVRHCFTWPKGYSMEKVAAALLARWCQENFFRYRMEHFSLDQLVPYGAQPLPETSLVVNPARRTLENEIRRHRTLLLRQRAAWAAGRFPSESAARQIAAFEEDQGKRLQSIEDHQQRIVELKAQRRTAPRHIPMSDLPPEQRFTKLRSTSKHFIDTIKMIAYRAETALLGLVGSTLRRSEDARCWIRQVLQDSVNLIPDATQKTLTVQLHPLSNPIHNQALRELCSHLTDTETLYPNTDLRRIFTFLGPS